MVRIILSTELLRGPHQAPPGPHWEPPGPYPTVSTYPVPRKSKLPRARGQKQLSIESEEAILRTSEEEYGQTKLGEASLTGDDESIDQTIPILSTSQGEYVQTKVGEASSTGDVQRTETNEREKMLKYLPLYRAGLEGDWQAAKAILERDPDAVRLPISDDKQYILHIATLAKRSTFVTKLLERMSPDDLELEDKYHNTALYYAALSGIVIIAKEMVNMNQKLPLIRPPGTTKLLPLHAASMLPNRDMVVYLFSVTPFEQLTATERINLLCSTIYADLYDIALDILEKDATLATTEDSEGRIALEVLANKPFALGSRTQISTSGYKQGGKKPVMPTLAHELTEGLWKNIQKLPDKKFLDLVDEHSSFLFVAAESGNVEFLTILLRSHPDLMWKTDSKKRNLFHISILHRQESVFNLIYEIGVFKDMIALCVDKNQNTMLHLAGELAPTKRLKIVSGAVFQMQHELLWFKEIEKMMPSTYLNSKNLEGKTPRDIFTEEHTKLQREGEKWMNKTANNCMLVATLIVTVVFAAAFTVPDENHQEYGVPLLLKNTWFTVFFVSDIIAMLFASISILISFSSILTSRYKEEDFLGCLPKKLVFGLTALLISMVGMMVAFSAACVLVYKRKTTWVPCVIITAAVLPIVLFVRLINDLLLDIFSFTFWCRSHFGPRKHGLFKHNVAVDPNKIDH